MSGVPVAWNLDGIDAAIRRFSSQLDDPDYAFELLMQAEGVYLHLLQKEREKRAKK